ncbi:MAG: hypothetical protein AABW63_00915 [Nanoarchaeota archaeon]
MRLSYIKRLVKLVEESSIDSLELSSWFSRLKVVNRLPKTIEKIVQSVEKKFELSTSVEKHLFIGHEYDYIKSNYPGTFYWSEDKSLPSSKLKWKQEIKKGDVLGYLDHFEGLYGNLMTEVFAPCDGYILRTKVRNGQKVKEEAKLFLIYVKEPKKPSNKHKKPKKPKKNT